jgi:putative ABC transport system substrate-binding protein
MICAMKKAATPLVLIAVTLLAVAVIAEAQQQGKIPWIGYLADAGSSPNQALLQALRDLGYVEGKTIGFVFRTTEGKTERRPELLAELIRLKVDIIFADGTGPALTAKKATSMIPIVMTRASDPVGTGLVASLARPGGNVTGLTNVSGELGGKMLELLKEIAPKLTRAAILRPGGPANDVFVKETEVPARALGVQIIPVVIRGPDDIEGAFRAITKEKVNGLVLRLPSSVYFAHFKRVAELTMKNRLPSIANGSDWVDAGGLMYYGANTTDLFLRAATYVDKILKGAKPADLPVEAPTKFELGINLQVAKQIGLTIPPNVLARADKVIK